MSKGPRGFNRFVQWLCTWLLPLVKQPWIYKFYLAWAVKGAPTAIEVVTLRKIDGSLHVLLGPRSKNDKLWAGRSHSFGSMHRESDVPLEIGVPGNFNEAFERIEGELGTKFTQKPESAGRFPVRTGRGAEVADVFIGTIGGEPVNGRFVPVDDLPEDLLEHHYPIIRLAVERWRKMQAG